MHETMSALVPFECPDHGVVLGAFPTARVQCRCGAEAAPCGVDLASHRRAYAARMRQRAKRESR